ncbi:MAG: thiamine phosphate synthase [Nitrospirales bacterium]|nr:thiamine phosphate synthase [Nitrospira sp.]MDR4503010.1 thiamine phosphate synthase [Nitrospirales bacterium]
MSPSSSCRSHLSGVYLILDESLTCRYTLSDVLKQAGEAGVRLVQYRNKQGNMREMYKRASMFREQAGQLGMQFIVNDRCDLAQAVDADGVHVGQSDLPVSMVRQLMGEDCLLGVSTHRLEEVHAAIAEGADYLGFGPIYSTNTKANLEPLVGVQGLQAVRNMTTLPIFAIGGITAETVPTLIAAGADGVAVASAILGATQIQSALAGFMSAFA